MLHYDIKTQINTFRCEIINSTCGYPYLSTKKTVIYLTVFSFTLLFSTKFCYHKKSRYINCKCKFFI
ncbi:hypothetical protein XO29_0032 [Bacillus phage phiS58]|uniref:Uncharacterized protein n=1 Tax=Bacillus phage phiS58 TaxID=1643327 RepID=A0A0S2MVJ3_9CAUD|nr:hypothetical protein XO29_0032 [Bacillus phage phiS58]